MQVGDTIKFKVSWGKEFAYTRKVTQVEPNGVWVQFMKDGHFVATGDFKKVKAPARRKPARWCYLIDLKTMARVSYADTHPARLRDLLARLTKQYPARDFGFRSARRRPVGDTVDRLDTETLHLD